LEKVELNIDPEHWEYRNVESESSQRLREMACEVILSFIGDVLDIEKISKCNRIISGKHSYQKKAAAKLMINRHIHAVNWFCSGEALDSVWFRIMGLDDSGQQRMLDLVHKRIEGLV